MTEEVVSGKGKLRWCLTFLLDALTARDHAQHALVKTDRLSYVGGGQE